MIPIEIEGIIIKKIGDVKRLDNNLKTIDGWWFDYQGNRIPEGFEKKLEILRNAEAHGQTIFKY